MELTPQPKLGSQPESSASAASTVIPVAASIMRGLMRVAFFLGRVGSSLDDAMGKYLEARHLRREGKSRALSLIGSGAILIAAFAPILNVPVIGAVTYFNGDSELAVVGGVLLVATPSTSVFLLRSLAKELKTVTSVTSVT